MRKLFVFLALILLSGSALAFDVVDSGGHRHTLADYKGKWVLVNFWATWCPPCREEIPDLIALHDDKRNNLVVIGIAMDYRDTKEVTSFANSMLIDYPIVFGTDKVTSQFKSIRGLPTSYLYNPEGKMVAYNVGALSKEAVENYITQNGKQTK